MNFIERLQYYMTQKGINDNKITVDAGLSTGLIGKAKKNGKAMNSVNIEKILLAYPDLNSDWLLTGRGEMLKTNCIETNSSETISPIGNYKDNIKAAIGQEIRTENQDSKPYSNSKGFPLVSVKAVGGFAGKDFLISENDIEAYYVIPKFRNLNVDFMIEVVGDSMMPRLFPGDIIACSIVRNSKIIQWNKTYLIATEDMGMIVKRLKKSTEKDSLLAVSDNSDYDPFDIPLSDITGLARVVGVIHAE